MLFWRETDKTIWKPLLSKRILLSNNPLFLSNFFYHPLFTQILKTSILLDFRGRGGNFGGIGVLREFVSLTMFAMEMGKNNYFSYHSNSSKEENILLQKHESFTLELPLIKFSWSEKYKAKKKKKNALISKKYIFSKRVRKGPLLHFMTSVYISIVKIEKGWFSSSHKKRKDSLQTWEVLIEISMLCWNLPSDLKHQWSLQ